MRVKRMTESVSKVLADKASYDPQPDYQRTSGIWKDRNRQSLIDSILRGYDLPKFYIRECSEKDEYDYEVVDGQQRLSTILSFLNNEFKLSDVSFDVPGYGDLSNKTYSELPRPARDKILDFELDFTQIEDSNEEEIRDLFARLNDGVALNPAEKRNAMGGNMRNFVTEEATRTDKDSVFRYSRINEKRFNRHDWIAHITLLELNGGPADVKAPDMKRMYIDRKNWEYLDPNSGKRKGVAKLVRSNLTAIAKGLRVHSSGDTVPEMNKKWPFVDLYLLTSVVKSTYAFPEEENKRLADFYIKFENERLKVKEASSLIEGDDHDPWDRDMYDYIQAFNRGGGVKKNVQTRHDVYLRRFLRENQDLKFKDPNRAFAYEERIVIWRRSEMQCQNCVRRISFDEMHADHVEPHIKGGRTTIENAQALCSECNLEKGKK